MGHIGFVIFSAVIYLKISQNKVIGFAFFEQYNGYIG